LTLPNPIALPRAIAARLRRAVGRLEVYFVSLELERWKAGAIELRCSAGERDLISAGLNELRVYRLEAAHRVERQIRRVVAHPFSTFSRDDGRTVLINFAEVKTARSAAFLLLFFATEALMRDRLGRRKTQPSRKLERQIYGVAGNAAKRYFQSWVGTDELADQEMDAWIAGVISDNVDASWLNRAANALADATANETKKAPPAE
jgi:hypothetical protein